MLVISASEFRTNQKSYLDKVDQGIEILIRRAGNKSYKLVRVAEDETLMSKEDFFAKIDVAIQEVKEGKAIKLTPELRGKIFVKR